MTWTATAEAPIPVSAGPMMRAMTKEVTIDRQADTAASSPDQNASRLTRLAARRGEVGTRERQNERLERRKRSYRHGRRSWGLTPGSPTMGVLCCRCASDLCPILTQLGAGTVGAK